MLPSKCEILHWLVLQMGINVLSVCFISRYNNTLLIIITIKLVLVLVEFRRDLLYINYRFWSIQSKAAGTCWLPKPRH